MVPVRPIIVITDLDGTLLDHETYRYDSALAAISLLRQLEIPLILNSSKTASEMMEIRRRLRNHHPFVFENGAGIYLPAESHQYRDSEIIRFGTNRTTILSVLAELREKYNLSFTGFNDMNVENIMECTGLNRDQAQLAMQREFSEPLMWHGDEKQWKKFCLELELANLQSLKGGRFHSISGKVDKADAMRWLRRYYRQHLKSDLVVIALGDAENDIPMLAAADYPVLVRSPAHPSPKNNIPNLVTTADYGPSGWNRAVIDLISKIRTNN